MQRRSVLGNAIGSILAVALGVTSAFRHPVTPVRLSDTHPSIVGRKTLHDRAAAVERASREVLPKDERLVRMYAAYNYGTAANTDAFIEIVRRESSFDHTATNKRNGRYGFGQALPDTYESAGPKYTDWKTSPSTQLEWMYNYILNRYGTPVLALRHHNEYGWY